MKKPVTLLLASLLASLSAASSLHAASKDKGLDVLISADAIPSPEGFRPKPGKPIHYIFSQTRQTIGEPIGGVKLPDPAVIERAIGAELEKQGFVRTEVGGAVPEILIVATVGDANFEPPSLPPRSNPLFETDFEPYLRQLDVRQVLQQTFIPDSVPRDLDQIFGNDPFMSTGNRDVEEARGLLLDAALRIRDRSSPQGRDRGKILALVGAAKIEHAVSDRTMSTTAADRIALTTRTNLYYVTLSAFDAARWREKQGVLLWRTTMLVDWRVDLAQALPAMLAQAGPVFGTDVAVPGFANTTREGKVEIGETQVISDKEPTPKAGAKK